MLDDGGLFQQPPAQRSLAVAEGEPSPNTNVAPAKPASGGSGLPRTSTGRPCGAPSMSASQRRSPDSDRRISTAAAAPVRGQNNDASGRPATAPPTSSSSAAFAATMVPVPSQAQAGAAINANAAATKAGVFVPRSILILGGPLTRLFVEWGGS